MIKFLSRLTFFREEIIVEKLENPKYKEVKIPKDRGKWRILHIPEEELKSLQKAILEKILYSLPVSSAAHCGVLKRSVKTHTAPHLESHSFFRIDFKEAFPSTTSEMIEKSLRPLLKEWLKDFNWDKINLSELTAVITKLTTFKNFLPQGAPTSPYLLNIVCKKLDETIIKISEEYNLIYTRYADDLWISSRNSEIPPEVRQRIIEEVKKFGFKINREKIKYKTGKATVPKITGINLVGNQLKIPKKTLDKYRAIINQAIYKPEISEEKIFGIISWVEMIEDKIPKRIQEPFKKFLKNRCPEKIKKFSHLFN